MAYRPITPSLSMALMTSRVPFIPMVLPDNHRPLIDRALGVRAVEREGGDFDVETLAPPRHHAVAPGHEAGRRRQRHAARVFEGLARREFRFLADDAGAAHLL